MRESRTHEFARFPVCFSTALRNLSPSDPQETPFIQGELWHCRHEEVVQQIPKRLRRNFLEVCVFTLYYEKQIFSSPAKCVRYFDGEVYCRFKIYCTLVPSTAQMNPHRVVLILKLTEMSYSALPTAHFTFLPSPCSPVPLCVCFCPCTQKPFSLIHPPCFRSRLFPSLSTSSLLSSSSFLPLLLPRRIIFSPFVSGPLHSCSHFCLSVQVWEINFLLRSFASFEQSTLLTRHFPMEQ